MVKVIVLVVVFLGPLPFIVRLLPVSMSSLVCALPTPIECIGLFLLGPLASEVLLMTATSPPRRLLLLSLRVPSCIVCALLNVVGQDVVGRRNLLESLLIAWFRCGSVWVILLRQLVEFLFDLCLCRSGAQAQRGVVVGILVELELSGEGANSRLPGLPQEHWLDRGGVEIGDSGHREELSFDLATAQVISCGRG